jgi:ethanolamine utilization protein EutN
MKQAKVIGRVFASRQGCVTDKKILLLIQPLDWETDTPVGEPIVAADTVGAGAGENVFYVAAREAIVAFEDWGGDVLINEPLPPVDAAIIGIIDGKNITEKNKERK